MFPQTAHYKVKRSDGFFLSENPFGSDTQFSFVSEDRATPYFKKKIAESAVENMRKCHPSWVDHYTYEVIGFGGYK